MTVPPQTLDLLRRGIAAAQAANRPEATRLLRQVTQDAPDVVEGWSWLAFATEDALERVGSMQRVAELDPEDEASRDWLQRNGFPVRSLEPHDRDDSISALWDSPEELESVPEERWDTAAASDSTSSSGMAAPSRATNETADPRGEQDQGFTPLPRTASSPDFKSLMEELAHETTSDRLVEGLEAQGDPEPTTAAETLAEPQPELGATPTPTVRAPRVLLVHSDLSTAKLLRLGFEQLGCSVFHCAEQGDALQHATRHSPDLIFSGGDESGSDPFELCRSLKALPETAGVAFVLHLPGAGVMARLKARSVGVDELLTGALEAETVAALFQRRLGGVSA
jgi:CheY-like chemotaxis protein